MEPSKRLHVYCLIPLIVLVVTLGSSVLAAVAGTTSIGNNPPDEFHAGRRPSALFSFEDVKLVGDDLQYVFTAPVRWKNDDWFDAAILSTSVVATTALDHGIRVAAQKNRTPRLDRMAKNVQLLGAGYSFVILGAFEGWALFEDSPRASAVAIDGFTSSLIATGIIAPVLKYSVGRARPVNTDRTFQFKPFSGGASFPSGHTTQAFAVASVIAADYSETWVKIVAYGCASLVGASRIEQNAHFTSDVVAGAIIGTLVGRSVAAHNSTSKPSAFSVIPLIDGSRMGLMLSRSF